MTKIITVKSWESLNNLLDLLIENQIDFNPEYLNNGNGEYEVEYLIK